jgi:hypothetical protein
MKKEINESFGEVVLNMIGIVLAFKVLLIFQINSTQATLMIIPWIAMCMLVRSAAVKKGIKFGLTIAIFLSPLVGFMYIASCPDKSE